MTQKSMSFDDFAIVTVKENDYRIIFWFMIKLKAFAKMTNADLNEETRQLSD